MSHAHARHHRKAVPVEIKLDPVLHITAQHIAATVGLRLHDGGKCTGCRLFTERPLGIGQPCIESPAQRVPSPCFGYLGFKTIGVDVVVGVNPFHAASAGGHIGVVMRLSLLVIDF
ncbi:hypothetical protein D3C71_1315130 [compost metagenome]